MISSLAKYIQYKDSLFVWLSVGKKRKYVISLLTAIVFIFLFLSWFLFIHYINNKDSYVTKVMDKKVSRLKMKPTPTIASQLSSNKTDILRSSITQSIIQSSPTPTPTFTSTGKSSITTSTLTPNSSGSTSSQSSIVTSTPTTSVATQNNIIPTNTPTPVPTSIPTVTPTQATSQSYTAQISTKVYAYSNGTQVTEGNISIKIINHGTGAVLASGTTNNNGYGPTASVTANISIDVYAYPPTDNTCGSMQSYTVDAYGTNHEIDLGIYPIGQNPCIK